MKYAMLAIALMLAGCGGHAVRYPTGEFRPLNPSQWTGNPSAAQVPRDLPKITETD